MKIRVFAVMFVLFGYIAYNQNTSVEVYKTALAQEVSKEDNKEDDHLPIDFRYLITSEYQMSPKSRMVYVFLDDAAFSEKNLRTLFAGLSKDYSDSKILTIIVLTNWNQFAIPTNKNLGLSNLDTESEKFEYHKARYFRNEESEYFTYNPVLKTEDFKKIVLKIKNSK